jgi:SAM-dependent methyltransferase
MSGAIENQYKGPAGQTYQKEKRAVPPQAYPWVARLRAEKFQRHVRPTDVVLEIGIGLGWNLAELRCGRRIGADLENFLPPAVKGIEFQSSTSDLPDHSMDAVICHHVLEHVEHPLETLREIQRLLRAGGKLLLHVPFEKETRYRHFNPDEPNHHLYSWNVQTLGNLVNMAGFKIQNACLGQFGYDRAAAVLALRFRLGETGFRFLRRLAHLLHPASEVRIVATV